ncbi:MAG: hypothetical protein QOG75_4081 [Mycobacterium sp.]|nr:hypothetical protein [Mycobacterium sp.]
MQGRFMKRTTRSNRTETPGKPPNTRPRLASAHLSPPRRDDAGTNGPYLADLMVKLSLTRSFIVGRAGLEPATNGL